MDYDAHHLRLRLGRIPDRLRADVLATAERRAGDDALGSAIRFWCLGQPASPGDLEVVLSGSSIADLEAAGLITRTGDQLGASLRITPALGQLLAHDFDRGGQLPREHVLGTGPATRTLAGLTPRTPVERALDIGTGCGVQAFGLIDHAQVVVATDISERAAWTARVSTALNDVEGIDIRVGDGLAPVAGERFDLIVANPPFVISPSSEMTFRDAASRGDELARSLVRDVVAHLNPGGVACLLVNWIVRADERVTTAAEGWLTDLPVKALLLQHDVRDPLSYAERWSLAPVGASYDDRRVEIERWVSELHRLGARSVASGAIIIERAEGQAAIRIARMRRRPAEGGQQVRRMLDSIGRFGGADDPALGAACFRLVHGHRIDQRLHYGHGSYDAAPAKMRLDRSAGVVGSIPAEMLEAVFAIDGERPLSAVAAGVAAGRGQSTPDYESSLRPVALELYELGLLELVDRN